jgi:hypothetical protein
MGGIENRRDRKRGGQHVGKDVHPEGRGEGHEVRQVRERQAQEGFRKGQQGSLVSLPGVGDQGGVYVGF